MLEGLRVTVTLVGQMLPKSNF